MEIKKFGAAKRFGARYGRRLKQKFAEIESLHKQSYKCPYCSYVKARRLASGIWQCRKCNSKFTSRAYSVSKKVVVEGPESFVLEEIVEEKMPEQEAEIKVLKKK